MDIQVLSSEDSLFSLMDVKCSLNLVFILLKLIQILPDTSYLMPLNSDFNLAV